MLMRRTSSSALVVAVLTLTATTPTAAFTTPATRNHRSLHSMATPRQWPSVAGVTASGASRRSRLSMHFGHSHSHHHHHHPEEVAVKKSPPKTWKQRLVQFIPKRRESGRVAFAAIVSLLLPALIRQKKPIKVDYIAFALISSLLTLSDKIRKEFKAILNKLQKLGTNLKNHSPQAAAANAGTAGGSGTVGWISWDNAADRVTLVGVVMNLWLSIAKFAVGVVGNSSALIADAAHSLSDLFSDGITLWAVQLGRLPPDEDHPYGHGKFEAIGSLFLALTLLATGVGVGLASYRSLLHILLNSGASAQLPLPPTPIAMVMALVSILSKEWLYRITKRVGEQLNSQVVIANAWHHRSDAYSSVLALASIALARLGWLAADAAAGLLVGGMIGLTGFEILGESIKQLTDTNEEVWVGRITSLLEQDADVATTHDDDAKNAPPPVLVRARQLGSNTLVDVEVTTPPGDGLSASALRTVEERLKWKIMTTYPNVQAVVHVKEAAVVCPLLTAAALKNATLGGMDSSTFGDSSSSDVGDSEQQQQSQQQAPPPAATNINTAVQHIQQEVRQLLPEVHIPSINVRYDNAVFVHVDVVVQQPQHASATSILEAQIQAQEWKERLEASQHIEQANLYLDLTPSLAVPVPTAPSQGNMTTMTANGARAKP